MGGEHGPRLGIDLGGTKIEGAVLHPSGEAITSRRIPSPQGSYDGTLEAIAQLVEELERDAGVGCPVGVGMPGSISPRSGRVQNSNSTWLNGRMFQSDISARLKREVRCANDANCFALSEATDGSGAGFGIVFGIILGTGCGGGIVIDGRIVDGGRGIGGEWGHNPLPSPEPHELGIDPCWCGRRGCLETWLSGPAVSADHVANGGMPLKVEEIAAAAQAGDAAASATLERHAQRLGRALAIVVNLIDPDVVVIGGGLSKLSHLYEVLPGLAAPYIFAERQEVLVVAPRWGDASGVRGAARLWP